MPEDGEGRPFKDIRLDSVRAKYWLGVGAQPSDPAWRLLSMVSDSGGMDDADVERKEEAGEEGGGREVN